MRNKDFKNEENLVQGVGVIKRRDWNPHTDYIECRYYT